MLRVIEGDGQRDDRLSLADVPLGPWAGAEVEFWAAKAGPLWHGNPECAALARPGRRQVLRQQSSGAMDNVVVPERLHCRPPGRLGIYQEAAETIVKLDAVTCDADDQLGDGDLNLSLFEVRGPLTLPGPAGRDQAIAEELGGEFLAELWDRCRARRSAVVARYYSPGL